MKRKLSRAVGAVSGAAEAGPSGAAAPACGLLLQAKAQDLPCKESAKQAVLQSAESAAGIHDLRPVGPWPPAGTVQAKHGRVP